MGLGLPVPTTPLWQGLELYQTMDLFTANVSFVLENDSLAGAHPPSFYLMNVFRVCQGLCIWWSSFCQGTNQHLSVGALGLPYQPHLSRGLNFLCQLPRQVLRLYGVMNVFITKLSFGLEKCY